MMPADLLKMFRSYQRLILGDLEELVCLESPSRDRLPLELLKAVLVDRLRMMHGQVRVIPAHQEDKQGGDHILAKFFVPVARRPALVLGHYDTVWPYLTIKNMPFRIEDGRAFGPGIFDMKAGLAIFLRVIELIERVGLEIPRPVWALFTSDEEIGSPTSRGLIEELARECAYVLVLEPPLADGSLKTARKGVGRFRLEIEGKAAHSGVAPQDGRSAIVELAHQVLRIQDLQDLSAGTTLNVGVIQGGTTANVIPAQASAEIDVRVASLSETSRITQALQSLNPVTPGVRIAVSGCFNRPPMERSPAIAFLFEQAKWIGRLLGIELTEGSTGGGSDGNFTAALGVPTLDGLGACGGGAHADNEHILIDSLGERAGLLAALLLELQVEL
jgi:glutamate carboxypeptidase